MKRTAVMYGFLLAGFPILIASAGRNLLKNGNFEKFSGSEPEGWTTTNIPKTLTVVSPTPRAHGGKTAVKCEVGDFFGSKMAGMVRQRDIDVPSSDLKMSGYYLLNSVGKDLGYIAFDFQNAEGSTVGTSEHHLTAGGADFSPFTFTVPVPSGSVHLELKCTLLSTQEDGKLHSGTFLILDDLELAAVASEGQPITP